MHLPDRFWVKVEKTSTCWVWVGARTGSGYGDFVFEGKKPGAHRLSYEALRGPIPSGLVIDHICRNRACVNPDHMEVVTHAVNSLRGISPPAINARKTHCKHGHPLAGDNLYLEATQAGKTYRKCRTCNQTSRKALTASFHAGQPKIVPSGEELAELLQSGTSWVELGRRFGVSDNAVRKWARKHQLL